LTLLVGDKGGHGDAWLITVVMQVSHASRSLLTSRLQNTDKTYNTNGIFWCRYESKRLKVGRGIKLNHPFLQKQKWYHLLKPTCWL